MTTAALGGDLLSVSETFLSFQGEGPSSGERAVFLRLVGCNLACSWCDTPYTWDWTRHDQAAETRTSTSGEVADELAALAGQHTRLLVITGGEPLLQQPAVALLLDLLAQLCPLLRCQIETNGTVPPVASLVSRVHRFVVSPKAAHSGVAEQARLRPAALHIFAANPKSVLKIVASGPADLVEAAAIAETGGFSPDRVWIMPLGTDPETCLRVARELADPVIAAGFNLTPRQHVLLWGNQRGK